MSFMETDPGNFKETYPTISATGNLFIKTAYVLRRQQVAEIDREMRALTPSKPVLAILDGVKLPLGAAGVHVRQRLFQDDIPGLSGREYMLPETYSTGLKHRQTSSWPNFKAEMDSQLKRNPMLTFFLAADDVAILTDAKKIYGDRVIFIHRSCDDRGPDCLQYALADIICLSRTSYILGSFWSSFTEVAKRMSPHGKVYLSGLSFAKDAPK